jgi:uncharacterized protein YndB with AHSA1/START domain
MPTTQIEKDIQIDAPPEIVWDVITQAEQISGWFSDETELELVVGGAARFVFPGHGTVAGRVEALDPKTYFAFRWASPADGETDAAKLSAENSTLVEFKLTPAGDGTNLHLTESGFDALGSPEEMRIEFQASHTRGWDAELGELVEYVAKVAAAR